MRFFVLLCCLGPLAAGCNSDPRCRRETALLRAEILDLEDKYYLMKEQRDQALAVAEGEVVTQVVSQESGTDVIYDGFIDGAIIYDEPVQEQSRIIDQPDQGNDLENHPRPRHAIPTESDRDPGVEEERGPADHESGMLSSPAVSARNDRPDAPTWRPIR